MNPKTLNKALLTNNLYLIGAFGHIIGYIFVLLGLTGIVAFSTADAIGFIFSLISLFCIVGLIFAYIARSKAEAWLQTYFQYMIRTFWITMLYSVLTGIFNLFFIPKDTFADPSKFKAIDIGNAGVMLVLFLMVSAFFIIRTLKARKHLSLQQPIPNPITWKI